MDRFEKLAKDMAGMNRRDALRRAGGGLAGAVLAAFGVGRARAQEGGGEDNPCEFDCSILTGGPIFDRPHWGRCINSCAACRASGGGTCFTFRQCEGEPNCVCFDTVEGGVGFCGAGGFCDELPKCKKSSDCPTGWTCSANTCCALFGFPPICNPPCFTNPFGVAPVGGAAGGPTTSGV
jgi:hypothetical protein